MASFPEKLAELILKAGLSQSELARQSGVSQTNISRYLRDEISPSWRHVQAIAKALGVTCMDLSDDEVPEVPEPPPPRPRGRPRKSD